MRLRSATPNQHGATAVDDRCHRQDNYTYDTRDRLLTKATRFGTVSYTYDAAGNDLTGQFTFGYDALSRRTSLARLNGVNTSYSYDSLSRLSVLHQAGTVTLDGASYTYDNAGNRVSKTNSLNNTTENYTYDPLYKLTQRLTTTESGLLLLSNVKREELSFFHQRWHCLRIPDDSDQHSWLIAITVPV